MDQFGVDLPEQSEPAPAAGGFPFPKPTLLVAFNPRSPLEVEFEGTLIQPVRAFDTDSIRGRRFESAIIVWSSYYTSRAQYDDCDDFDLRRRLVDWVNLEVSPRLSPARRPVWL